MRVVIGLGASAVVLVASAASGLLGTWALLSGTVSLILAAVGTAIVLEERDVRSPAGTRRPGGSWWSDAA